MFPRSSFLIDKHFIDTHTPKTPLLVDLRNVWVLPRKDGFFILIVQAGQ